MQPLQFSLKANSVPVQLETENGMEEFKLNTISASQRDAYMDKLGSRLRLDNTGKVAGIRKFDGMQADLLSVCLTDANGKHVSKETIQTWPSLVVAELFAEAQKLNGLNKGDEEDEGQEPKKD